MLSSLRCAISPSTPANIRCRGFAAKASSKVLETVSVMGEKYPPLIEEDAIVSVSGEIVDKGQI
jgi:hypothetical protein